MKDKIFGVLQRIGRSFMLPIAILPVAGLLLGLGSSFTNQTTIATYRLEGILGEGTLLHSLLVVMNHVGSAIFDNLPLIFAVGVAIGMAKKEKEVAALAALIAFFVMHISINSILELKGDLLPDGSISPDVLEGTITSVCGITSLQMGVFGGIIVGLGVAALHNRFYRIQFPNALSFFAGSRFIPIISTLVYMVVGILMYFVWPLVQNGIYALGSLVTGTGYLGTFFFGIIKRALIPFGLHHVFYLPFWQTALGGSSYVAGQLVSGGQNIFFAQLADAANITHFSADATRYFSGEFIFMIFGLPGAALAMYRCARPDRKKAAGGLLLSAALTSMLTGITEPLEFSFLFIAPALFGVQVLLAGSCYMVAHILNIAVGLTFSGGLIDLFLFGILQGNTKTGWLMILPAGIIYFFLYYFSFSFLIRKYDLKTPGREDGAEETRLYTKADVRQKAHSQTSALIAEGLGSASNILDVDCCATRLRITVKDPSLVSDKILKASGAKGVLQKGPNVQVIYGPQVTVIKVDLEEYLANPTSASHIDSAILSADKTPEDSHSFSSDTISPDMIFSPATGTAMELSQVKDGVFSEGLMGPGAAILPEEGKIYAPFSGTVSMVFDTKHALSLISDNKMEILIHIGIDTVNLKGRYFHIHTSSGEKVKKGQLLVDFDLEDIKKEGYPVVTPVILVNGEDHNVQLVKKGRIQKGEDFLMVE